MQNFNTKLRKITCVSSILALKNNKNKGDLKNLYNFLKEKNNNI